MKVLQPPGWANPKGYSNGVTVRGRLIFVAGQVGWDEQCIFQADAGLVTGDDNGAFDDWRFPHGYPSFVAKSVPVALAMAARA